MLTCNHVDMQHNADDMQLLHVICGLLLSDMQQTCKNVNMQLKFDVIVIILQVNMNKSQDTIQA